MKQILQFWKILFISDEYYILYFITINVDFQNVVVLMKKDQNTTSQIVSPSVSIMNL